MDYQFLIELGAGLVTLCYLSSRGVDYLKHRSSTLLKKAQTMPPANVPAISSLIQNIDSIIDETHKLREAQIKAGATPESLKPLDDRLNKLEWVRSNKMILQYIGPYADQIYSVALKALTKVIR